MRREDLSDYRYHATQEFFLSRPIQALIRTLATEDRLTIFLGAGASVAQGLPSWNELLLRMLRSASKDDKRYANAEQRDLWCQLILSGYDSAAAGSVVRARMSGPTSLNETLYEGLYQHRRDAGVRERGSEKFSEAVWELVFQRRTKNLDTTLVTLNFDDCIERAFRLPSVKAKGVTAGIRDVAPIHKDTVDRELAPDVFPVVHAHGYLPKERWETEASTEIILSTSDFAGRWHEHWSAQFMEKHMDDQWLMVGMSFQDTHVGSLLRRRQEAGGSGKPPIGVVSTQGRPWNGLPETTIELLAEAEQTRLAELGMIALVTTYFFQDYTFLKEIANQTGSAKTELYHQRRGRWQKEFIAQHKGKSEADRRAKRLTTAVTSLRQSVEELLPRAGADEQLRAEVWIRDMTSRSVRLAASSEFIVTDSSRAPTFPLAADSTIAAVRAITHGAPRTYNRPLSEFGPWRSFVAFPIHLQDDRWLDLPVASLVLGSTLPLKQALFVKDGRGVSGLVDEALKGLRECLTPGLLTPSRLTRITSASIDSVLDSVHIRTRPGAAGSG